MQSVSLLVAKLAKENTRARNVKFVNKDGMIMGNIIVNLARKKHRKSDTRGDVRL